VVEREAAAAAAVWRRRRAPSLVFHAYSAAYFTNIMMTSVA